MSEGAAVSHVHPDRDKQHQGTQCDGDNVTEE